MKKYIFPSIESVDIKSMWALCGESNYGSGIENENGLNTGGNSNTAPRRRVF